jgi:hypothetical protein
MLTRVSRAAIYALVIFPVVVPAAASIGARGGSVWSFLRLQPDPYPFHRYVQCARAALDRAIFLCNAQMLCRRSLIRTAAASRS